MNELVQKIHALDLDGFITVYRKLNPTDRFAVLNQQDVKGKTLLHHAAECGAFELIKHLMGLDIQLDAQDFDGKTPAVLAEETGHKDVAMLLVTRAGWASKNGSHLPLNKAVNLIEGSYQAIEGGKGKELVLVLGETGVGKSTLINYLNGAHYRLIGRAGFDQSTALVTGVDIARVGHNPVVSETLYPQVLRIDSGQDSLEMADLAGINGTREPVIELAGTLSTHLLSKMAKAIKSILFVVDVNSLNAGRGGAFRQTIKTLNKILQGDFQGKASRSVYFAITKLPSDIKVQDVVKHFLVPLQEQLEGQLLQGGLSREDMEMYHTVKLMIHAPQRIFVPDVCDKGSSRKVLFNALLHSELISSEFLDLLHVDKHQEAFIEMLTFLSGEYLHITDEVNTTLPGQITLCTQSVLEQENNIKKWQKEIDDAKKAQEEGLTPEKAIQMMQERQASLKELDAKYAKLTEEKTRLSVKKEMTESFIQDIDVDTPVEYGSPYRFNYIGEVEVIQSDQPNPSPSTKGKEIGATVGSLFLKSNPTLAVAAEVGGMIFDLFKTRDIPAPKIQKKTGNGTFVFDNSDSPAPGNILDIQCAGNSGCFGRRDVKENMFRVVYTYPLGESGTAEVIIKIAKRDLPENKVRIERGQKEMQLQQERLAQVEAEAADIAKQIDVLTQEMNGLQVSGISAAAQQEALKTQISQRETWIESAQSTRVETEAQLMTLEKRVEDLKLQLKVNDEIFATINKIIKILHLNNVRYQTLSEFCSRFETTNGFAARPQSYSPAFYGSKSNATHTVNTGRDEYVSDKSAQFN